MLISRSECPLSKCANVNGDLKAQLAGKLTPDEVASVYRSYDVVGDLAIIRVPEQLSKRVGAIAEVLMEKQKHIKAVWQQVGPVAGSYRLRTLEWVAGEKRAITLHREYGSVFKVDIQKCYFSPRLAFERRRIANVVLDGDIIVNMFAGVGCYSIIIAVHSGAKRIYSIDVNPVAVEYMRENVLLNRVADRVIPIERDADVAIKESLKNKADRVIMPLPEKAHEHLPSALSALKSDGGWIHFYSFEACGKGEDSIGKAKIKAIEKLQQHEIDFTIPFNRIVRQTGPNWCQIALDIAVKSN